MFRCFDAQNERTSKTDCPLTVPAAVFFCRSEDVPFPRSDQAVSTNKVFNLDKSPGQKQNLQAKHFSAAALHAFHLKRRLSVSDVSGVGATSVWVNGDGILEIKAAAVEPVPRRRTRRSARRGRPSPRRRGRLAIVSIITSVDGRLK